ncbi:hypothetical protein AAP84_25110, partial [Salmonella enterica subsp. enterica]|nr:hypothetical protein [Salmonella enterica subsp. enterica serovar Litchfield]
FMYIRSGGAAWIGRAWSVPLRARQQGVRLAACRVGVVGGSGDARHAYLASAPIPARRGRPGSAAGGQSSMRSTTACGVTTVTSCNQELVRAAR